MNLAAATIAICLLTAADVPTQSAAIGDRRLPMVTDSTTAPHPLSRVEQHLRDGEFVQGAERLADLLRRLDGRLIAPTGGWMAPRRWGRLGAPDEVLGNWMRDLQRTAGVDLSLLVIPQAADAATSETARIYWDPRRAADARRALDHAVEGNDLNRAWRLLRALRRSSAEPPGAKPTPLTPIEHALLPKLPRTLPASPLLHRQRPMPKSLRLSLRIPLDGRVEIATPQQNALVIEHPSRRHPVQYVPSYPLVIDDSAVVVTGSRARAISLDGAPQVRWEHPLVTATEGAKPGLVHLPIEPLRLDTLLLLPARTTATATPKLSPRGARWPRSWLQWQALIRVAPGAPLPTSGGLQQLFDEASRRGTIVAPPLIADGRVYLLVATGWEECTLELLCGAQPTGRLQWSRVLGAVEHRWHSSRNVRTLLPSARLLRFGGDIIASTGRGWLARVSATTGSYRGILLYESWGYAGLPFTPRLSVGAIDLRTLPRPEVRPPSPMIIEESQGTPTLYLLPDDSQHLLAIDLGRWQVAWAHGPVARSAVVFPAPDGALLVVDGETAVGDRHSAVRFVDRATGRVVHQSRLTLPLSDQDTAPLLVGPPLLLGERVVVPTITGLMHVTIGALRSHASPAAAETPWPAGTRGGCVTPLPHGRWLAITAGTTAEDPAAIEIYSSAD